MSKSIGAVAAISLLASTAFAQVVPAGAAGANDPVPTFRKYCFGCHSKSAAMGGLSLDQLTSAPSVGDNFHHWEKVITALDQKRMPPPKLPQPSDEERSQAVGWIRAKLNEYAQKNAGDPGRVTVRRLTSGEYTYTVQDLTGLDLKFDRDFASDSVGGEGFTNFGDVQFVDDANLERYLEAAKRIADHAVIGAGPIRFFEHSGKSGFELSAINRIQDIYKAHGFRAVAGEGARPYGLEQYGKAFYAAWRYRHRAALGEPKATIESLARANNVSSRFVQHIWKVLQNPASSYPVSDVAARWKGLPAPSRSNARDTSEKVRALCNDLQQFVVDWPRALFAGGPLESTIGDDKIFLLTDKALQSTTKQKVQFGLRSRGQKTAKLYMSVASLNPAVNGNPVVTWSSPTIRMMRQADPTTNTPRPRRQDLSTLFGEGAKVEVPFQRGSETGVMDPRQFTIAPGTTLMLELPVPAGAALLDLDFTVEVASGDIGDAVLRCTMAEKEETRAGRTSSVLLANAESRGYASWKAGVLEFAELLPQFSHGEPTPSDRDPIAEPFNNAYNQPERDHFHGKIKYFRTDRYLVENILDDKARADLDAAWADLLLSFDYYDQFLRFVASKYKVDLGNKSIDQLDAAQIQAFPDAGRVHVARLKSEHDSMRRMQTLAQAGHIEDCVRLANVAWRRPLSKVEGDNLRAFYNSVRESGKLDHPSAVRALLARIFVAPAFLYRLEPGQTNAERRLSEWEIASRLSYFLWSSVPDDELRRAAAAGELSNSQQLERQVKRMLADVKARRLSTEFFGQWLGFYRFDQYRGVDTTRFPEFTDEVKSGMYDEAVSFFEHIVRKDRPVGEMVSADYTFLNEPLAKHYNVPKPVASKSEPELVEGANAFQRGGLLRLGAVLTATSAPLRTSPVKRGDWILRRVLGTPTPPPPADAGSIPADDKLFGGLTVFERLQAHQRNPTCAGCHSRIDPLGFPLERYDAVGRWRSEYSDGKPIQDSVEIAGNAKISGVEGLVGYLKTQEKQVLKTFSYKLLGYALGRTILASDQPLVERLTSGGSNIQFSKLVSEIVASRQFRYRRDAEESPPPARGASTVAAVVIRSAEETATEENNDR